MYSHESSYADLPTGKVAPHNLEAEQSVLGAALSSNVALSEILSILSDSDFYSPNHALIFEAIFDIYKSGNPVDIITLSDNLESKNLLEKVGGFQYISSLPDLVPFISNAGQYANTVRQKAILRKFLQVLDEVKTLAYEDSTNVSDLLELAAKKIYDIRENRDGAGFDILKNIVTGFLEEMNPKTNKDNMSDRFIKTGFQKLDNALGGIARGALVILAARPGMGKTAFALNIAYRTSFLFGKTVAFFSLEMSKEEIAARVLSTRAFVDSKKIRSGTINPTEWESIIKVMDDIGRTALFVDDRSGTGVMEMMSKCRQLKLEHNLGLIVIDYLQLMSEPTSKNENRQQEISTITRSLKLMARELNVPVLALSQLSRASEKRGDDKEPILSDLRDSGSIEQDADIVMFIHRENYYKKEPLRIEDCHIMVAKNRTGETGRIRMKWYPKYLMFFEPDEAKDPEVPDYPGASTAAAPQQASQKIDSQQNSNE